jgi:hypothetical protein
MSEEDIFIISNYILAIFSIFGCIFIICVFVIFKSVRSFEMEQVFYLSFSCLISTISYLLQLFKKENVENSKTEAICQIQSFLMIWFEDSQYIIATLISYSIYISVIYSIDINHQNVKVRRIIYILISYLLPLIISIIFLFLKVYGPSDYWCYIDLSSNREKKPVLNKIIYTLNYVGIFWFSILLNSFFTYKIIFYIKKEFVNNESELDTAKNYIRKLLIFPITQAALLIPCSINRVLELLEKDVDFLKKFHSLIAVSTGLAYFIIYGLNNQIKHLLKSSFNFFSNSRNRANNNINNFEDHYDNMNKSLHHFENNASFIGQERDSI